MLNAKLFDEIAQKLVKVIPPEARELRQDIEKNFQQILSNYFTKLDLVNREEFDVQSKVLAKTRQKLEALENQVKELEKLLDNK